MPSTVDRFDVFSKLRHDTNPGTMAKKIVKRASIEPWKNFFNSLRATAETDLMDEYGLRRACQWAGNSAGTAMKNYALVKKTDFTDSGTQNDTEKTVVNEPKQAQKSDAKSDAIMTLTPNPTPNRPALTRTKVQKTHEKTHCPKITWRGNAF